MLNLILALFLLGAPTANAANTIEAGDLVTCEDTASVFYINSDNTKWVFPNEKVFYTWYHGFAFQDVKNVTCEYLSTFPLEGRITYRPASRLVKITSSPKTYVIEPGGVLRWVPTEQDAINLYGDLWWTYVEDIPEVFWSDYEIGEPLSNDEIPNGSLIFDFNTTKNTLSRYYFLDGDNLYDVTDLRDDRLIRWSLSAERVGYNDEFPEAMSESRWAELTNPVTQGLYTY